MVTLSSTSKNNLHKLETYNSGNGNNNHHLHDAIFSPHLNSSNNNQWNFVGKVGEPSQKIIINPFISNNRKSPLHHQVVEKKTEGEEKEESGEIGVFGAEKYFNGGEVETPRSATIAATKYLHHHQRDHEQQQHMALETSRKLYRHQEVQYGTPSTRSESTCNSQSALLLQSGVRRNSLRNKKENKGHAKGVLAGLGLKCSCSDKNSVDISDHAGGEISFNRTTATTPNKIFNAGSTLDSNNLSVKISKPNPEIFINNKEKLASSTVMNSGLGNHHHHLVKMQLQLDEEGTPRKSLEVFGSPILSNKSKKSMSMDKRLLTMTSFVPSKVEEIDSNNYNDAASDASSDLFEIESLKEKSNNNNNNPFLSRQTSDAASSCVCSPTTTSCYAPSEASIQWSVVTASAAVLSDCEEQMSEVTIRSPIRTVPFTKPKAASNREIMQKPRRPGGILLGGCKSHKAVRVAGGDSFITYEKQSLSPRIRSRANSISQVTRFPLPAETKMGNFGARNGQPPLQDSHSPHASKLLYI